MRTQLLNTALAALAAAGGLAACASDPNAPGLFDRAVGDRVHGDASSVTVTGMGSVPEAFPLAIGHCGHFKKSAQYARRDGAAFVFNCVDK
ncbi:MAG: hypothetical protein INR64_06350 [Caulobacteraceae bacterium]|nr:hypothetical protein [Caulobacter sp.]